MWEARSVAATLLPFAARRAPPTFPAPGSRRFSLSGAFLNQPWDGIDSLILPKGLDLIMARKGTFEILGHLGIRLASI